MMHGKKENSGGVGKISKEGQGHPKSNGKVVRFSQNPGEQRKQKKKVGKSVGEKKILDQIEIPFPNADGIDGETRKLAWDCFRCPQGSACGAMMGTCNAKDRQDEERKEGIAAAH
jgi:hypothetical protein